MQEIGQIASNENNGEYWILMTAVIIIIANSIYGVLTKSEVWFCANSPRMNDNNVNQINDLIGLRREWTQLKRVYELETTLKEHVLIMNRETKSYKK